MAEVDLVLCGVDGIHRAGAVGIVVAGVRHLHVTVLRGCGLRLGVDGVSRQRWLRACDHRTGAAKVDYRPAPPRSVRRRTRAGKSAGVIPRSGAMYTAELQPRQAQQHASP